MKLSQLISNHKNPFEGRNKDEVWAELNSRPKQHLDKDKILEEMKQELMKRNAHKKD
jgi:hypothetical protein